MLLTGGSAVVVDQDDVLFGDFFCQLSRSGDGGRAEDKLWFRAVKCANSFQSSHDISQMRAKNSPIMVDFVNHHKFQILKNPVPSCVKGQNPGMQHIRIGDNDLSHSPDSFPG